MRQIEPSRATELMMSLPLQPGATRSNVSAAIAAPNRTTDVASGGDRAGSGAPRRALASATPPAAFTLIVVYVILDYVRVQDLPGFGALRAIRPALLLMLGMIGYLLAHRDCVPAGEKKFLVCGLLAAFMASWIPFATNNYWAFQITIDVLTMVVFIVALSAIVDTEYRFALTVRVFLGALAFQAVWGLTHEGHGNGGIFGDENDLSLALNLALPFAVVGASSARSVRDRIYFVVCGILCICGIVVSFSRGGFLGLVVVWIGVLLMTRRRLAVIGLTFTAVLALSALAPPGYFEEMQTMQNEEDGTRKERIMMWGFAWKAFEDNPIFGVGPGNIPWRIGDYEEYDDKSGRSHLGFQMHSIYLTLLPELGITGVVLYSMLVFMNVRDIGVAIRIGRRNPSSDIDGYARALAVSLAAYLTSGAFISVLYVPHFYYLTALTLAARRIAQRQSRAIERGQHV